MSRTWYRAGSAFCSFWRPGAAGRASPPVDPADAGRQLGAALEAWKNGEPFESMAARTPPVVFNEPLWEGGAQLVAYKMEEVQLDGRQGRCTAVLTLRDKTGKQYERRIGYQIDTLARVVIVREGLGL